MVVVITVGMDVPVVDLFLGDVRILFVRRRLSADGGAQREQRGEREEPRK